VGRSGEMDVEMVRFTREELRNFRLANVPVFQREFVGLSSLNRILKVLLFVP
jgi:hypothetical protein